MPKIGLPILLLGTIRQLGPLEFLKLSKKSKKEKLKVGLLKSYFSREMKIQEMLKDRVSAKMVFRFCKQGKKDLHLFKKIEKRWII